MGVGDLLGSVVSGKNRGALWGRESVQFHRRSQGPCEPILIPKEWGTFPQGRLLVGSACLAPALSRILARNDLAVALTKAVSWGLPPFFHPLGGGPIQM